MTARPAPVELWPARSDLQEQVQRKSEKPLDASEIFKMPFSVIPLDEPAEAGVSSEAMALAEQSLELLQAIDAGHVKVFFVDYDWDSVWCGDVVFKTVTGWTIVIFNDCDGLADLRWFLAIFSPVLREFGQGCVHVSSMGASRFHSGFIGVMRWTGKEKATCPKIQRLA